MIISKWTTRLLQLLLLLGLSFSFVSCRINSGTTPTTTTPTTTNTAGKQAPSLNSLQVFFDAETSSTVTDDSRQPILIEANEQVTLYATFGSSTALDFAHIFLIPEGDPAALQFNMTCNDNHQCNYLWDLSSPVIEEGLYSLTVRAQNQEGQFGTVSGDYENVFLVY